MLVSGASREKEAHEKKVGPRESEGRPFRSNHNDRENVHELISSKHGRLSLFSRSRTLFSFLVLSIIANSRLQGDIHVASLPQNQARFYF